MQKAATKIPNMNIHRRQSLKVRPNTKFILQETIQFSIENNYIQFKYNCIQYKITLVKHTYEYVLETNNGKIIYKLQFEEEPTLFKADTRYYCPTISSYCLLLIYNPRSQYLILYEFTSVHI